MSEEKDVRPTGNKEDRSDSEEDAQDHGCFRGIFKRTSTKRNQIANPRYGSSIFANFLRIYIYVGQNFLRSSRTPHNQLKQLEDSNKDSSTDDSFPTNWPRDEDMREVVEVKMCALDSPVRKQYRNYEMTYSMKKQTRGKALIINNQNFTEQRLSKHAKDVHLSDRTGSEKDRDRLSQLFDQLHFSVEIHNDLTVEKLLCLIRTESENKVHEGADCFILTILSHGSEHGIYGVDGDSVSFEENIKPLFTAEQCPFLAGKPKLFFIQACQGGTYDTGVSILDEEDSSIDEARAKELRTIALVHSSDATVCHPARKTRRVPTFADMFVASSCTKGFVSFRHETLGSWFIQAIVYVFQRYAHEKEINHLFTMVKNLVAKAKGLNESTQDEYVQAAITSSTLTKDFLFFPGVFEGV